MLVREVMTTTPVTVPVGTPIKVALQTLMRTQVTALPVLTKGDHLAGIVSEADLIREQVMADPRLHEIPHPEEDAVRHQTVDEVMTAHVVTVGPDADLVQAVELLTSTTVKSLPVVDRAGRVVGMISRSDIVRTLAQADVIIERDIDAALVSVGLCHWSVEVRDGAAELVAPRGAEGLALARIAAGTVPGVTSITVRSE
jgi:CBS-domain-containing membrane protein